MAINQKDNYYGIRYRDEFTAGDYFTPSGSTSPDVNTVTFGSLTMRFYSFDGGSTIETMSNSFEVNHDVSVNHINAGKVKIELHVHCMPSSNNAGFVRFVIQYAQVPTHGIPLATQTKTIDIVVNANTQHKHLLGGVELDFTQNVDIGDIIIFSITRLSTQDTYADDILFIKSALHVPLDDLGSRQRYIK
jgi:hypothetical protein